MTLAVFAVLLVVAAFGPIALLMWLIVKYGEATG